MSLSPQQARKQMFALVDGVWNAKAAAIVGGSDPYVPHIRYQGAEEGALPGADKFWMRCSTQGVMNPQRGHRMPETGISQPVYDNIGFITLQIFAPMKVGESYAKGELLAELGQCMFMASETGGSVWFRNPRIRELDNDGTWYRWNVIADYQFSQVKGI
jgi:hypothetical protein